MPLRIVATLTAWLMTSTLVLAQGPPRAPEWTQRSIRVPIAGQAIAFVPRQPPDAVVLFVSGDGGWNLGVIDMARRIATHAVVVGISFPVIRKAVARQSGCWYPAGDLEVIAKSAEKQLGLREYRPPVLIGYSSGATLVYAAIAGAPEGTFAGAVSLGFCPDLEVPRRVCKAGAWAPRFDERKHVTWLPPQRSLQDDWYVLHGNRDRVCSVSATRAFVDGIAHAHLVEIEKAGHGFSRPAQWGWQFDAAVAALSKRNAPVPAPAPSAEPLARELENLGLPLEVTVPSAPRAFFIFISGDGGWASLDRGVADALQRSGIGVIGWSAIRYFWTAKTPQQVVGDLQRIIGVLRAAGKPIVVGGYSFGAEVVPVALASAPASERQAIASVVSIAPAPTASFEIDPLDWIREGAGTPYRVADAFASLRIPVLCIRPADDAESGCADLPARVGQVVTLPGSHHFNGRYGDVAAVIERFIDAIPAAMATRR